MHPFIVPVLSRVNYQLCMVAQKFIVHILQFHTQIYLMHSASMYVRTYQYYTIELLVT